MCGCRATYQYGHAKNSTPDDLLGEGDTEKEKDFDVIYRQISEKTIPSTPSIPPKKWKLGPKLTERGQLEVLQVLTDNNDRFAYVIEELERYTGPPMEIKINTVKYIFRPPHKLGEKEWAFVGERCTKLEKMGFIRKSYQSHYASATVVVRKKDENGEYTDFRKCGDYRPLNLETDQDRYQLPLIESIFNEMGLFFRVKQVMQVSRKFLFEETHAELTISPGGKLTLKTRLIFRTRFVLRLVASRIFHRNHH